MLTCCMRIDPNLIRTVGFKFGPTFCEIFHALFELVILFIISSTSSRSSNSNIRPYQGTNRFSYP